MSIRWVTVLVAAVLLAGCTGEGDRPAPSTPQAAASPTRSASPSGSALPGDPTSSAESATGSASGAATAAGESSGAGASPSASPSVKPHPVSLPALFERRYDGRGLRLGQEIVTTDAYTQHFVTYTSGRLTISGVMNVPHGRGPFPVLVLAHGYIDPAVYANGQGLRREQDWLARAGYVVLHTDYRNHAASDDDPRADVRLRLGYTIDVVNAVRAVKRSRLRFLDKERVGLLGRSMGGGVLYNVLVAQPGLVDAAVVFAPVSSLAADNFDRWIRNDSGRAGLSARIIDAYGTPERRPAFWRAASPRPYFDRITEPVLIHHGTADESCPIRWSRQTLRALRRADVDSRMFTYPGQPHAFDVAWPQSMRRTVAFLDRHLDVA